MSDRNKSAVEQFFVAGREVDRLSFMTDDVEWWNGLGKFPAAPGQTVFRGKDEVGARILGRAPSPRQPSGRRIDRYDLSTISFHDVHTIAMARTFFVSIFTRPQLSEAVLTKMSMAFSSGSTMKA